MSTTWLRPSTFVSRVAYGLVAEIGISRYPRLDDGISKTRRRVLEWIGERTGYPDLLERADEPFDISDQPGVKLGLAISADNQTWISRMERPDQEVPQRTWMTEAAVVRGAGKAFLVVRNTCTAPSESILLPRSVPALVKTVSYIVGLWDAGESLDRNAWYVESDEDVRALRALVTNRDRFLPVVLVTEPYAFDVEALAQKMYGVAHVVALPNRLSYDWASVIGKPLHAYLGAVRTYNPGLDVETSDPFDHPMALRDRIHSFAANGESGAEAFSQLLSERAYASNAARITLDPRGVRFSQVSAASLDARREVAIAAHSAEDVQELAAAQIAAYKKQSEESAQMEAAALEDNQNLETNNNHLRVDLYQMQMEIARMQSALESAGKVVDDPAPTDFAKFDEFMKWCERTLTGRVVLLPRALRELKASEYEKPADIFNGLLLLSNEFWRMKAGVLEYEAFAKRLAELGMEYGGSIEQRFADESYYVPYGGKSVFMGMALKISNSREARYCMRIYTFWDNERRVSVVGSLPAHLDNRMT
jgi:hypothetical protein